jgi:hypothetical protein
MENLNYSPSINLNRAINLDDTHTTINLMENLNH